MANPDLVPIVQMTVELDGFLMRLPVSSTLFQKHPEALGRVIVKEWQDAKARADAALIELRPEVLAFARLMEQQLRANDHKPGWKHDSADALIDRLNQELDELADAVDEWPQSRILNGTERVGKEAADVANFAMMLADICGALA